MQICYRNDLTLFCDAMVSTRANVYVSNDTRHGHPNCSKQYSIGTRIVLSGLVCERLLWELVWASAAHNSPLFVFCFKSTVLGPWDVAWIYYSCQSTWRFTGVLLEDKSSLFCQPNCIWAWKRAQICFPCLYGPNPQTATNSRTLLVGQVQRVSVHRLRCSSDFSGMTITSLQKLPVPRSISSPLTVYEWVDAAIIAVCLFTCGYLVHDIAERIVVNRRQDRGVSYLSLARVLRLRDMTTKRIAWGWSNGERWQIWTKEFVNASASDMSCGISHCFWLSNNHPWLSCPGAKVPSSQSSARYKNSHP